HVEPDRVSDNLGWKAMALVADSRCLHCSQIRRNRDANNNRAVNVTSPPQGVMEPVTASSSNKSN
ncbi:MAG: hypothetical protein RID96_18490, partial [Nitratireductor sp.]